MRRRLRLVLAAALLLVPAAVAHAEPPAFHVEADAIYFDLDGTALDSGGHVPAATTAAVRAYRACGGRVGIATGRTLEQAREAIAALEPDLPVVLFNGGAAYDVQKGAWLFAEHLNPILVATAVDHLRSRPGVTGVMVNERDATFVAIGPDSVAAWTARSGAPVRERWKGPSRDSTHAVVKLLVLVRPDDALAIRDELGRDLGSGARVIRSGPRTLEVVPPGVNKATAIRHGLDARGEHPARIVAFGDSGNDVEMLKEFSLGIAMGNCLEEACRAAQVRIGDHNSGDLARTVANVLVGPKCWDEHAGK